MIPLCVHALTDLRVSGSYGLFIPGPSPGRVAVATIDWQTTLAVELAHSRALDETRGVAIQVSLWSVNIRSVLNLQTHDLYCLGVV